MQTFCSIINVEFIGYRTITNYPVETYFDKADFKNMMLYLLYVVDVL
jgi:hypothetical protein